MYEMSCCVSLFSRCYFEIFMDGDVFASDLFYLETSRIPGKGLKKKEKRIIFYFC